MDMVHIIDGLMGIIVLGGGWFLATQSREVKRIDILLNKIPILFILSSDDKYLLFKIVENFISFSLILNIFSAFNAV